METTNSTTAPRASRLVNSHPRFDAPNDLEEKLSHHFNILKEKIDGKTESEVNAFLATAAKTPGFNEIASDGFLYGILTDIPNAHKHFSNFFKYCMSMADGWYQALLKMNMVLLEIFYKLKAESRHQIIFFFAESIRNNIPKIDNVLTNLLRTVSEGSDYKETCTVIYGISDILVNNKDWMRNLKAGGTFAPVALLCLSRFICDLQQLGGDNGTSASTSNFRNAMINVCEFLLKERFADLLLLGRDLVLILLRLSKIPPFTSYWRSLLNNPSTLSPKCNGISQLMAVPCANILFSYRVSLHVGRKLEFLLKMRSLAQTKYLDWFNRAHLSGADSGSLRSDIIRYIWFNVHLPEFQQPVVIEIRAQILAWLIKNAKGSNELQWCKLMLFWDWFGFDPQVVNSIQLVEPAFSLIRHLVAVGSPLINNLLDYLLKTCNTLHPPLASEFIASVAAAFKALASAGMPVIAVLESARLEKSLRDSLHETFPDIFPKRSGSNSTTGNAPLTHGSCISGPGTSTAGLVNDLQEPGSIIDFDAIRSSSGSCHPALVIDSTPSCEFSSSHEKKSSNHHRTDNNNTTCSKKEKHTSDSAHDSVKHKKKLLKKKQSSGSDGESAQATSAESILPVIYEYEQNDKPLSVFLPMVKEEFREHLEALSDAFVSTETDNPYDDAARESLHNFLAAISDEDDGLDDEQSELIAECLLRIFHKYFKKRKFLPDVLLPPVEDSREESIFRDFFDRIPLYTLYRQMSVGGREGADMRRPLLMIMSDMREKCGSIGYLFLYFIRGVKHNLEVESAAFSAYEELCRYLTKSMESQIVEDMQQCALHDHNLFAFLLTFVFDKLSGNSSAFLEMIHLVCSHIDAKQLSDLVGEIIRENIILFRRDSFANLLISSLSWETVEQMILWHLIRAEGVPLEWMVSIIPRLNYNKHTEAATNVLIMMKNLERDVPMPLLRNIISRSPNDLFTVHALKVLIDDEDNVNKIAQMLNSLVKKLVASNDITHSSASSSSSKSTKSSDEKSRKSGSLTVSNVFAQLDNFRRHCLTKDSHRGELFLSNPHLQEIFAFSKKESKMTELRSNFSELFAIMEIFNEGVNSGKSRKHRPRGTDSEMNPHNEGKVKRRRIKEETSDDEDR